MWSVRTGPTPTPPLKGRGLARSYPLPRQPRRPRPPPCIGRLGSIFCGAVAGTVRLWDVALGEGGRPALLLGPLAVDPALKNAGLGSALMRHAIAEAARLGHAAILLVGDAPYYARFGFSADRTGALAMPGPYERHRFLALELKPGALDGAEGVLKAAGRRIRTAAPALAGAA